MVAELLSGSEAALADLTFTAQCVGEGSSPAQALCSRDDETIPIVSHLFEMKATLTATISAVCADIKTRSKARMEESRRLKVSCYVVGAHRNTRGNSRNLVIII